MMTNEDLWFHAGKVKLDWIKRTAKSLWQSKIDTYDINGDHYRQGIINWQKEEGYPLLPECLECIPRDEWDFKTLTGVSKEALNHIHYDVFWEYMYRTHKPRNKVLTVFECSNAKPYQYVGALRYYTHRWADYSDFASIDYGIQLWDYSNMYPSRWDEWDHYKETEEMQYLYSEKTKKRILEFHERFPEYEKMIFICQNDHPQRPINELWKENTGGFRNWAIILTDAEFRQELAEEYEHMHRGMLIQRTVNTTFTHNRYASLLASLYDDQESKTNIIERATTNSSELQRHGIFNIYSPDEVRPAYERGLNPFSKEYLEERKLLHKPKKRPYRSLKS